MTPREIIAKAWAITVQEPQLRWWGYASALFATLLNAKLFIYQSWFVYSYLQGDPIGFFTIEAVLKDNLPFPVFVTLIVLLILLLIVEWLLPHFAKGAIIGLAAKKFKGEEVKGGLVLGIYNFFPIFAIHEALFLSSITMAITLSSLSIRYGGGAAWIGVMIIGTTWLITNIIEFFWIFSEEAVVIRKEGIRSSIRRSFKLVISYLGHVVFLLLLMLFIFLRIIANLLMVILVPSVVMGLGLVLTFFIPSKAISYGISSGIGLIIIALASYLFAYLEVFRQTVWTITYIELGRLKDLDVIEHPDETPVE